MKPALPFALTFILLLWSCTSTPKNELTKRQKWKLLEQKPSAMKGMIKSKSGEKTEYIFVQESDVRFNMIKQRSEMAKACEDYARQSPSKVEWLESCNAVLDDPATNGFNHSATSYNKALILGNLGRVTQSRQLLIELVQSDTGFSEADFELARLEYEDENYHSAIKYAQSAIAKNLRRPNRAYYILGKSYEKDFNFISARQAYKAGLDKNPGARNIRKSLERLDRLWPEKSN